MNGEIIIARKLNNWMDVESLVGEIFPELIDINEEDYLYVGPDYQIPYSSVKYIRVDLYEGSVTLLDAQNNELYKDRILREVHDE